MWRVTFMYFDGGSVVVTYEHKNSGGLLALLKQFFDFREGVRLNGTWVPLRHVTRVVIDWV